MTSKTRVIFIKILFFNIKIITCLSMYCWCYYFFYNMFKQFSPASLKKKQLLLALFQNDIYSFWATWLEQLQLTSFIQKRVWRSQEAPTNNEKLWGGCWSRRSWSQTGNKGNESSEWREEFCSSMTILLLLYCLYLNFSSVWSYFYAPNSLYFKSQQAGFY